MSALGAPALEQLLALTLAKVAQLERSATEANLRALAAETARDVALDQLEHHHGVVVAGGRDLRHEATQASVELRSIAHTLKSTGRPVMAAAAESRADKLVKALRV